IYQNIAFIERYDPEYVLVLSGDHIYKMDYSKMIEAHKEKNADCTIAVLEVEMEEAKRFGIMNANPDGSIYEFEEKPAHPKSNLASMGIYIFTWEKLRRYLVEDEADENSSNDFGKNIIPNMLGNGEKLYTYRFDGYWKDVGTIDSLWEANMDLLDPNVPLNMSDKNWRIYSRTSGLPPHYIGKNAKVQNSMICEGGQIEGNMEFSIAFPGVVVEEGAEIVDAILMPGAHVGKNAKVQYAILAENTVVEEGAVVGEKPEEMENLDEWGVAVVASGIRIGAGVKVPAKAMIEEDQKGGEQ
ncbi:MAG: glucose-1-phosphate adenylyltransferase, partial [Clostridia bacterium]|nr:glucose-1-phosphate adenylyltransferase [Clostridia bacterium]